MSLNYSEYACISCNKRLLKAFYISLTDDSHEKNDRYCYECQKNTFGLSFWKKRDQFKYNCYHCGLDLFRRELFDLSKKYYIFTDMSDACQIAFCKACFEEASPK